MDSSTWISRYSASGTAPLPLPREVRSAAANARSSGEHGCQLTACACTPSVARERKAHTRRRDRARPDLDCRLLERRTQRTSTRSAPRQPSETRTTPALCAAWELHVSLQSSLITDNLCTSDPLSVERLLSSLAAPTTVCRITRSNDVSGHRCSGCEISPRG
jgi:hypothetical protein